MCGSSGLMKWAEILNDFVVVLYFGWWIDLCQFWINSSWFWTIVCLQSIKHRLTLRMMTSSSLRPLSQEEEELGGGGSKILFWNICEHISDKRWWGRKWNTFLVVNISLNKRWEVKYWWFPYFSETFANITSDESCWGAEEVKYWQFPYFSAIFVNINLTGGEWRKLYTTKWPGGKCWCKQTSLRISSTLPNWMNYFGTATNTLHISNMCTIRKLPS